MTGYSVSAVRSMRLKHTTIRFRKGGAHRPRRPLRVWTEQEKALLKELSTRELAERLGSSIKSIRRARREFGIRREIWPRGRKRGPAIRPWTAEEEALLGTAADNLIAKRLHRGAWSVRQRRLALGCPVVSRRAADWTSEEIKVLGTMPDAEAARLLNRTLVHRFIKTFTERP